MRSRIAQYKAAITFCCDSIATAFISTVKFIVRLKKHSIMMRAGPALYPAPEARRNGRNCRITGIGEERDFVYDPK
jgi:hypothetical protein